MHEIQVLRDQLRTRSGQTPVAQAGDSLESKLDHIAGGRRAGGGGRGAPAGPANLNTLRSSLARLLKQIENADQAPTAAQVEAYHTITQPLTDLLNQWQQLKQTELKALNQEMERDHLAIFNLDTHKIDHDVEDQIEVGDEE